MSFVKNLRAKILLSSLVPGTLALVAVALIALFAYEGVARNVVQQRDTELAKVSATRLSEGLTRHTGVLQTAADDDDLQSLEPARIGRALERVQFELFAFDAGVVIYNDQGVAVGSDPFAFQRRGEDFPLRSEFDKVRTTRHPSFSNVFDDANSGEKMILVTVPIVASGNEFKGVLAGMSTLESLVSDVTYSKVLEITADRKGFAYLVDGQGQTIYHRDTSLLGEILVDIDPVKRATRGETDAVIADDPTGESVISGFAPVPDSDFSIEWAVITQDRWTDVVGPIRRASRLMLGLLVLGAVLASALVFFAIGRVLKPVRDLTEGAKRIAGGDFDDTIAARTGDEIQALADQFNTMAGVLKESYTDLERRVEARTGELRHSEERYRTIFEQSRDAIFITHEGQVTDANQAALDLFQYTRQEAVGLDVASVYVEPTELDRMRRELDERGSVNEFETRLRRKDGTEIDCLLTMTVRSDESGRRSGTHGVIHDITDRKRAQQEILEQTRELAVLEERNRIAREMHDTMAQGFTGIVLQLEAGEQALEDSPREVQSHLSRAKKLARDCLQEARRSVWNLLPKALEDHPLDDALRAEVREFNTDGREKASFRLSGNPRELPSDVQVALLRICQESLTNVRKHANSTKVLVNLTFDPDVVSLRVQDNGTGFDLEVAKNDGGQRGFGLMSMEQRAKLIRGDLDVRPEKGKNTVVEVRVPAT